MSPHIRTTNPKPHVAHVELHRPERLNAFTEPMWHEMGATFTQLAADPSIRAIVLSGAGEAFSAGIDLRETAGPGSPFNPRPEDIADGARYALKVRKWALEIQDCISAIERCHKPVICVLHGTSLGFAVDVATAADVRICSADTALSVKEIDIAVASDIGTLARLPKIVGSGAWVRDVCYTGRTFYAEEALRQGLVARVLPSKGDAVAAALDMAETIAAKSPVAVEGTKNFLNFCQDHDTPTGLAYMAAWNGGALNTPDVRVAIDGVKRGRKPVFEKL